MGGGAMMAVASRSRISDPGPRHYGYQPSTPMVRLNGNVEDSAMMGLTQLVSIGALTMVALGPALGGQQQAPSFDSRDRPLAQGRAYKKLFTPAQKQDEPFQFQFPRSASTDKRDVQPRVICGMVTIPVTPDLDAKMVVAPKKNANTDNKIRMIEPQICNK
jgi:hypothetical protein